MPTAKFQPTGFKPSEIAEELLRKRYYQPGENWDKLCVRVATALSKGSDEFCSVFYTMMVNGLFLPNTPCLVNAGKPGGQLAACFVLPVEDSIDSIFEAIKNTALIHKSGGGTGFDFSKLRPEGSFVGGSGGVSSGPVSFMKVFDAATQQMKQGGVRRGANMGTLRCDHPDIVRFIRCKEVDKQVSNFNISVAITDQFMRLLRTSPDEIWICKFNDRRYYLDSLTGSPVLASEILNARAPEAMSVSELWKLLCQKAWANGEPGVLFIDEIQRCGGKDLNSTNPCGEVPLRPYEACVLGSIDVSKCIQGSEINMLQLANITENAVFMLNNMLDVSSYPLPQITEAVKKSRKIGLGIMGFADALIKMKVPYHSSEAFEIANIIIQHIKNIGSTTSQVNDFRNETITTIAPTGSLSIIAGCSSGIEPNYNFITKHHRPDIGDWIVRHPLLTPDIDDNNRPAYFCTAAEVQPPDHILMQSIFQKSVDNAVSKTINLPNTATLDEVSSALQYAYDRKCKGITVYRDGSRDEQVLSSVSTSEESSKNDSNDIDIPITWEGFTQSLGMPDDRPYSMDAKVFKVQIQMGEKVENAYIAVSVWDSKPYEIFLMGNVRDAAPIVAQVVDSTTRLTSLALRGGIPLARVIDQLQKIQCGHMFSIPHKVAHVLKEFLPREEEPCPECGTPTIYSEGCTKCPSCGWGKCS